MLVFWVVFCTWYRWCMAVRRNPGWFMKRKAFVGGLNAISLKRFHDQQIINTNTCGWAVFSHVNFLFRDVHADRANTNALAGWNLQHFFYFFSFLSSQWLSGQDLKMYEYLWNATVHVLIPQGRALSWRGVSFNFSDELLRELIVTDQDGYLLTWLHQFLFGKGDASKDTDQSWNQKKKSRLEKRSSDTSCHRDLVIYLQLATPGHSAVVYEYTLRLSSRHFFTAVKLLLFVKSEDNVWRNLSILSYWSCSHSTRYSVRLTNRPSPTGCTHQIFLAVTASFAYQTDKGSDRQAAFSFCWYPFFRTCFSFSAFSSAETCHCVMHCAFVDIYRLIEICSWHVPSSRHQHL